jgi:hypothetical protein
MDLLALVVCVAASYRLTRLVVLDTVLGAHPNDADPEHPRGTGLRRLMDWALYDAEREVYRNGVAEWLAALVSCTFCTGVWVSAAVTCVWLETAPQDLGTKGWVLVAAVAGGQGFVSSRHEA